MITNHMCTLFQKFLTLFFLLSLADFLKFLFVVTDCAVAYELKLQKYQTSFSFSFFSTKLLLE